MYEATNPQPSRNPDLNTYYRFACWTVEQLDSLAEVFPDWLPVDPARYPPDDLTQAAIADAGRRHTNLREMLTGIERQRLRGAGVRGAALDTPEMLSYVSENVDRLCVIRGLQTELRREISQPAKPPRSDDKWRPSSRTVAAVITGTHVACGKNNRAATAVILNRGLPKYGTGLNAQHVRNGLDAFVRISRLDHELIPAVAGALATHAHAFDSMWRQIRDRPDFRGLSLPERVDRLTESGEFLRMHADALAAAPRIKVDGLYEIELIDRSLTWIDQRQAQLSARA